MKHASDPSFQLLQLTKTKLWFFILQPRFNEFSFGNIKNKNSNQNISLEDCFIPKFL